MTTVVEFARWIDKSNKGESLLYHVGNLAFDRANKNNEDHKIICAVGSAAHRAYEHGQVALVQRRVSSAACEYLAIRN